MDIIADWKSHYAGLYGRHTLQLQHRLNETGLFSEQALAELIDRYPEALYNLSTMGSDPANPVWREGHLSGLPGTEVIEALKNGRIWLNLRQVQDVDVRYARLLESMFAEFEDKVPGLRTFKQNLGILISSPKAQVFYHADIPGQSLWQLAGRKRIYLYPNTEPFLSMRSMESMILGETEEDIPYEPWFDEYAEIYDLKPGQMLHWALNGPHRVVNEDCMNISVTTEHFTDAIRRSYAVHYANGVMRRFGMNPTTHSIHGPAVYPKMALALAWKKLNLAKSRQLVRMLDFRPDPNAPLGFVDMPAMAKN